MQIPVSLIFGYFIDICMALLSFIQPQIYVVKFAYLLMGCLILGIGVYIEVLADVVMLPGESFVRSIVFRWKTEFGVTKVSFDITMSVIAAILSFIFVGSLNGVREGTIVAALLVGFVARYIGKKLPFLPELLFVRKVIEQNDIKTTDDSPVCIIIDGQFGSGEYEFAKRFAKKLSCKCYDKEIIRNLAGTCAEQYLLSEYDEHVTEGILHDLVTKMYSYSAQIPENKAFLAEQKVLLELTARENCIIVTPCADFALKDQSHCLRVFLSAPFKQRVKYVMEHENLSEKQAHKRIRQVDKKRADRYWNITKHIWGLASNYQLCLDTTLPEEAIQQQILQLQKVIAKNK